MTAHYVDFSFHKMYRVQSEWAFTYTNQSKWRAWKLAYQLRYHANIASRVYDVADRLLGLVVELVEGIEVSCRYFKYSNVSLSYTYVILSLL